MHLVITLYWLILMFIVVHSLAHADLQMYIERLHENETLIRHVRVELIMLTILALFYSEFPVILHYAPISMYCYQNKYSQKQSRSSEVSK